jgi:Flp pilus assembly protein TadD
MRTLTYTFASTGTTGAPDSSYTEYRQAQGLFDEGYPAEAARLLASIVDAAPGNTAALELYARALFASAQLRTAEKVLRTLIELRPHDGWARFALARTLERAGRSADAAEHRRIAAALGVQD